MKWDMEMEEIEAVFEKIWNLHDKLSDAILSISRTHFLNSIKALRKSDPKKLYNDVVDADHNGTGFVFAKDFRINDSDSAVQEAKSLNAIRTALENLEDQLEFFQTVQQQQQSVGDAALARLEQSRIILSLRLAEHSGKKYKVIDEALAFVGDVDDATRIASPESINGTLASPSGENLVSNERSNLLTRVFVSIFNSAKKSLKFDHIGGILSTATLFSVSMIAMLHLHQIAFTKHPVRQADSINSRRNVRKNSQLEGPLSFDHLSHLDVFSAQG